MAKQLEAALAEQLGAPEGIKINIEAPPAPAPNEPGGTTWRKAYEDIKARAASLESQLQKARRLAEPTSASAFSEASAKVEDKFDPAGSTETQTILGANEIREESVLRLLSLAALSNQEDGGGGSTWLPGAVVAVAACLEQRGRVLTSGDASVAQGIIICCGVLPLALPFQASLAAQQCGAMTENVEQVPAEPPANLQQTDAANELVEAPPKKELQLSTTMVTPQEPAGMDDAD
eukprot:Skav201862  [mRNA]  locus=scaffold3490:116242:131781:- [translate_table: standard]